MDSSIDELLIQGTCAVLGDGLPRGTAWLLDGEGHLLTAGHLVQASPTDKVEVQFYDEEFPREARRVACVYERDPGVDWALLQLIPPWPDRRPLPISRHRRVDGEFLLYGFGKTLVDLSPGRGRFIGLFHPQNRTSNRLFALNSPQTREGGYSGSAVYSDQWKAVVAIQIEGTTVPMNAPQGTTVLAMPLYRIESPLVANLLSSMPGPVVEPYYYHVYLSYERGGLQEKWLEEFFLKELTQWLELELSQQVSVFYDHNPRRVAWDDKLVEAIRRSYCLVPVLTGGYWRSTECLAELNSFERRQELEKVLLTYGVLFHEGGRIPGSLLPHEDFQSHAYVFKGFQASARYGQFQEAVKRFARKLAGMIRNAPEKVDASWPVSPRTEMKPRVTRMPVQIARPTL